MTNVRVGAVLAAMLLVAVAAAAPAQRAARALALWLLGTGAARPAQPLLASAQGHAQAGLPVPMILGYYYDPGEDPSAAATLAAYEHVLTGIVPFWYTVHADGSVTGQADPAVVRFAAAHHLWVFALVQNMAGAPVFDPLLRSPLAEARLMENLLALVEEEGFDGINLDFEGIPPEDRGRFTSFVRMLSRLFHASGYYVTLSLPAETADEPANSWTGAYDYAALGRAADLVMIMAYDQHSELGPPGSIASTSWVDEVLRYATRAIPPDKIILGIPAYGYDWQQGAAQATALTYEQAAQLARIYAGGDLALTHFAFYRDGQLNEVWYENRATFAKKIALAEAYNVRGIVLWRLGIEDPGIWQELGG